VDNLWIPSSSPFKSNKEWRNEHFQRNTRYENVLFKGENVLTPEGLSQMYAVHERMMTFQTNGATFHDMCYKLPIEELFYHGKNIRGHKKEFLATTTTPLPTIIRANSTEAEDEDYDDYDIWDDYFDIPETNQTFSTSTKAPVTKKKDDYLDHLPRSIYCDLVSTLDKRCAELSLLEIWDFDGEIINNLSQQEILDAVNTLDKSPWFFSKRNYLDDLSGLTRNSSGHVIGAQTMWTQMLLEVPEDAVHVKSGGIGFEFEVADENSLQMEQAMIDICEDENGKRGFEVYSFTARSFNDVSFATIFFDVWKMLGGYVIMFFYTVFMLGRINKREIRLYLAGFGILACILGLGASLGLSFMFGLEYNQTHNILPFIAIGIGIDDMFVIMACWYNLAKDQAKAGLPLAERVGLTMEHAGVSVTVTSITDILAFGIGACTIMPGLSSFCITAAVCIAFIFMLQTSWTVAWLVLDQQRIERNRHGIFPWLTVKEETKKLEETSSGDKIIDQYSDLFKYWPFKVLVLFVTGGLLSMGVYGSINIVQRFDANKMLPVDSYLSKWISITQEYYTGHGFAVSVMTGSLQIEDLQKLDKMVNDFDAIRENGPNKILREVKSWWRPFQSFLKNKKNMTWDQLETTTEFRTVLSDFLFDVSNAKQQFNFKFDGELECNTPTPPIIATQMELQYGMSSSLPPPSEYLPAKAKVDQIIAAANISSKSFATSPIYQAWETDSIIAGELWRNLGLALGAVGLVALVMLGDLALCLMVMACVMLTLVDVVGTLHFWGVTIDVISCVNIILATGLCVDYSVHLAHSFSVASGTRISKTKKALSDLGPAIANAGMTTFLAVIILPASSSHVFLTFFKIFGLTVVYGVFHGLVFLPVLLSSLGPSGSEAGDSITEETEVGSDNRNNNRDKRGDGGISTIAARLATSSKSVEEGNINPVFNY